MNDFLPNLAFEDELLHPERSFERGTLAAITDLAPLMALVANPNDRIVLAADSLPEGIPFCLQHVKFIHQYNTSANAAAGWLVPWGWTKRTSALAKQSGQSSHPSLAAVHTVNSRRFLSPFDKVVWKNGQPPNAGETFGRECDSIQQFSDIVTHMLNAGNKRLVVKPQISHAGRNRIFVDTLALNDQQQGWLKKRIDDGLYVEPWVVRQQEWSVQYNIPSPDCGSAAPQFVGVTQLLNDSEGRYAGNILLATETIPNLTLIKQQAEVICTNAQAAGYWGPVGIDSFQFHDSSGNEGLRLCNDINARFTMGRLALHLAGFVQNNEFGAWCQFPQRGIGSNRAEYADPEENAAKILTSRRLENVSVVRTSPQFVGGKPVRTTTLLLTGPSIAELTQAQQVLHGTL